MNGVVLIDKPSGKTSYRVVDYIKKIPGVKKVGHTGTLDPLATGVLPVCINEATKLVQFLSQSTKEYRATMLLGIGTDTLDIEGNVIARSEADLAGADIQIVLKGFIGRSEQRPPRYSAIKYKGKPMYKWARAGYEIDPSPRMIEIRCLDLVRLELPYVTFDVSCSKGTYIRSLCRDIGEKLGIPACLAELRRTRSGHFAQEEAISIEGLEKNEIREKLEKSLISMNDALQDMPFVTVEEGLAGRIRQGYQPSLNDFQPDGSAAGLVEETDVFRLVTEDNLLAVARWTHGECSDSGIKILRVFNN